jgi:hypothetical protein
LPTAEKVCCIFNIQKETVVLTQLLDFLKRSPGPGDRKDPAMASESPASPAPDAPPAPPAPTAVAPSSSNEDFHRQLLSLADAVRELSRSQQSLIDAVNARPAAPTSQPVRAATISGDPGDGLRPSAAVDYTRLSPTQQIALGLRSATPQGSRVLPARAPVPQAKSAEEAEILSLGAD